MKVLLKLVGILSCIVMAVLWVVYLASCFDDRGCERLYYGVTRCLERQSAAAACARRRLACLERPVLHLQRMVADTLCYKPLGQRMSLQHALAQEAILTALAMSQGYFARGGPWPFANLGAAARAEAERVAALAASASDTAAARRALLALAPQLPPASRLRRHVEDRPFKLDSAEPALSKVPPRASRRKSGKSLSGNLKREKSKLKPGTVAYNRHKWGVEVQANRKVADRRRYVKRRPAAASYKPRSD